MPTTSRESPAAAPERRDGAATAVNNENLVVVDQLLRGADGVGGLASIVLADVSDLAAVDAALAVHPLVDRLDPIVDRLAVIREWAGEHA